MGDIISDENNNKDNNNEGTNNNPLDSNNSIEYKRNFIWIDGNIYNVENNCIYNELFAKYNIKCERFENNEDGFRFLNEEDNKFKNFVIIISGKLFVDFYNLLKKNIKLLTISPTIIIFCSKKNKHLLINNLKMNNIYYSKDFFDPKLIFTNTRDIEDFINNTIKEDEDLTFDIIDNYEQLIIPNYYQYLFEDVTIAEINYFHDYILRNFNPIKKDNLNNKNYDDHVLQNYNNDKVHELINQIKYTKIPKEIIIKYWLKIYTLQSKFFDKLNKSLRRKDKNMYYYYPFIKLCYEGIKKGFLSNYNNEIYRYSWISKNEFEKIENVFNSQKKGFPKIIVFSRCFLSFTKEKNRINLFNKGNSNNSLYSIIYIIQKIENIEENSNKLSNANIEDFSELKKEKEVLVFPFSCFEIIEIKKIGQNKVDYEIYLKYLGCYSKYIETQFDTNFFDKIEITYFSEELLLNGILNINNFLSTWIKKEENEKLQVNNICFFLDGEEEDFISFINYSIIVFSINLSEIKQAIEVHNGEIIDVIKLKLNRICSSSRDNTIKIIEIYGDNRKNNVIQVFNSYALQMLSLNDGNFVIVNELNNLEFYTYQEQNDIKNKYKREKDKVKYKEDDKILKIKKLPNGKIICVTENNEGNKFINYICIKNKIKETNIDKIEESQKLKLIDILIFYDYLLICFDFRIDIISYQDKSFKAKYLKYFNFELTNIISLSSNRLILGIYDSEKKESFIREHLLRIEDLQNNKIKLNCIGEGKTRQETIKNILKINESQIIINREKTSYSIFERKYEIAEILKNRLKSDENKEIKKEVEKIKNNKEGTYHKSEVSDMDIISTGRMEAKSPFECHENKNEEKSENKITYSKILQSSPFVERAYQVCVNQSLKPVNIEEKYDQLMKDAMTNKNNNIRNPYDSIGKGMEKNIINEKFDNINQERNSRKNNMHKKSQTNAHFETEDIDNVKNKQEHKKQLSLKEDIDLNNFLPDANKGTIKPKKRYLNKEKNQNPSFC